MFFSLDAPPDNPFLIVLWPVILLAVAAVIAYAAWLQEREGRRAPWKWVALLPLFIGLLIGWSALRMVTNASYEYVSQAEGMGRKVALALWVSFALPILGTLALVGLHFWQRLDQQRY